MQDHTQLLKRFGKQLRIFRKQKLLSREGLGRKAGLSVKDIEDLETGTGDPTLTIISLLAEALNLSPAELLHLPSGHDSECNAYRFHLLQVLNGMSKKELRQTIQNLGVVATTTR